MVFEISDASPRDRMFSCILATGDYQQIVQLSILIYSDHLVAKNGPVLVELGQDLDRTFPMTQRPDATYPYPSAECTLYCIYRIQVLLFRRFDAS